MLFTLLKKKVGFEKFGNITSAVTPLSRLYGVFNHGTTMLGDVEFEQG